MDITIMEGLQIALLSVSTVAVIALTAVLIRVFRLLGPVLEIIGIYKKVRAVFMWYSQIPDILKDKVKDLIRK